MFVLLEKCSQDGPRLEKLFVMATDEETTVFKWHILLFVSIYTARFENKRSLSDV